MATTRKKKKTRGKRKAKAAGKAPNPAFAFLTKFMERKPNAVYADARAAAEKAGHTIYPIMWGRAQTLLGRVKSKKRGTGKTAMAKQAAAASKAPRAGKKTAKRKTAKKRVGRPRKTATSSASNGVFKVASEDLDRMSALVDALNSGGQAVLRYAGDGWELAVE